MALGKAWAGAQELLVRLQQGSQVRGLAYTDLVGVPAVGEKVLLTTAALARGLGTGGYGFVAARPDQLPADPEPAPGHLVKARYTPLQTLVLGADEQESPHHGLLQDADDLAGTPVIAADLHSAVPAIIAGIRAVVPTAQIVYVMTDGGALPMAFSRSVAHMRATGWLDATITTGQAFGGDYEAVSLHSALLVAHLVCRADAVIVAQGPGNLGTGTRWGFSGVAAGETINAAATLGGRPIGSLRVSAADPRERHRGISHHSLTAYGRVALVPADIPVPLLSGEVGERVRMQARQLERLHTLIETQVHDLDEPLSRCPVTLSTMGRGIDEDATPFLAAAASGKHAASLIVA